MKVVRIPAGDNTILHSNFVSGIKSKIRLRLFKEKLRIFKLFKLQLYELNFLVYIRMFARVEPFHKSKIVEYLQTMKEITAMTGKIIYLFI